MRRLILRAVQPRQDKPGLVAASRPSTDRSAATSTTCAVFLPAVFSPPLRELAVKVPGHATQRLANFPSFVLVQVGERCPAGGMDGTESLARQQHHAGLRRRSEQNLNWVLRVTHPIGSRPTLSPRRSSRPPRGAGIFGAWWGSARFALTGLLTTVVALSITNSLSALTAAMRKLAHGNSIWFYPGSVARTRSGRSLRRSRPANPVGQIKEIEWVEAAEHQAIATERAALA
jgi:hypothetical protein